MPVDPSLIRNQADRLKQEAESSGGSFGGKTKWWRAPKEPGLIRLRILPFTHIVTEYDVAALRIGADRIGDEILWTHADIWQQWIRTGDRPRPRNCWAVQEECPLWIKENQILSMKDASAKAAMRKKFDKPGLSIFVNVVDMKEPEKGVQIASLPKTWFYGAGEKGTSRQKSYGIWNWFAGYEPPQVEGSDEVNADEIEGGSTSSGLKALEGRGDAMLGIRGKDIGIMREWGESFGKKALVLQYEYEHGPVFLFSKGEVLPESYAADVTDLWNYPPAYPGWSRIDEECHPAAQRFSEWRKKQWQSEQAGDTPVEVETKTEAEVQAERTRTVSDSHKIEVDLQVDESSPTNGEEQGTTGTDMTGDYSTKEAAAEQCQPWEKVTKHRDNSYSVKPDPKKKHLKLTHPEMAKPFSFSEGDRCKVNGKYHGVFHEFTSEPGIVRVRFVPEDQDTEESKQEIQKFRDNVVENEGEEKLFRGAVVMELLLNEDDTIAPISVVTT